MYKDDNFSPYDGFSIEDVVRWYKKHRTKIDLDELSLYFAAKMFIKNTLSPYNSIYMNLVNCYNHFNHPSNDLDLDTELYIRNLAWDTILTEKDNTSRQKVDSILSKHPENVLIKRYIQMAKIEQFCRMYVVKHSK